MNRVPTLHQVLGGLSSGAEVLDCLRAVEEFPTRADYPHYGELSGDRGPNRDRIWAGLKLRRAGTRMVLPPPLGLSFCRPDRLQDLLLEVMAPMDRGLSLFPAVATGLDEAEARIRDAIALARLDGHAPEPAACANLLRTGRAPHSADEGEVVTAYRGLSPTGGEEEIPEGIHAVLGWGLLAAARARTDQRGALMDWRNGLASAAVPEIRRLAPLSHVDGDALRHALQCMASDEQDATYPLLVLLAALRDARREWMAAATARADRLARLGTDPAWNERQLLVLDQVGQNPRFATALAYHKQALGVVYETARTDLQELARNGQLTMTRQGRAFVFTAGTGRPDPSVPAPPPPPAPALLPDTLPVFF